jgi:hypothetical protein
MGRRFALGDPSGGDGVEPCSPLTHSSFYLYTALTEGVRVNGGKVKKPRAGIASIRLFVVLRGCMLRWG